MTVVLGLIKNNQVWLSADTRIVADTSIVDSSHGSKLIKLKDCVVGFAGNVMFREYFELYCHERLAQEPNESIFNGFTSRLDVMKVFIAYWAFVKDNHARIFGDDEQGYTALVATPNTLYEVDSDNTITELSNFGAIGSGGVVASGVMDYLLGRDERPEVILEEAHNVACKYDSACGGSQEVINVTRLTSGKRKYTRKTRD